MATNVQSQKLADCLAELDQLTDWEQRPRGGMRVDLEPMRDLTRRLGDPHNNFHTIHVAGTKGKSSTCALIEAGLVHAGYSVGRYGSPHIAHICERITLNGKPVSEEDLASALDEALMIFKEARLQGTGGRDATWFDLLTIAAFLIFRNAGVTWAVVETGLGGRLDSTNIVHSEAAVITNIELEHTEVLGKTRAAIAFEKAGILKAGSLAVTPLPETDEAGFVVHTRARELGCTLVSPIIADDTTLQQRNAALVGTLFDALGARGVTAKHDNRSKSVGAWLLDAATLDAALLPGRMETFNVDASGRTGPTNIPVVLDGAHVPFNLAAVMADLAREHRFRAPCVAVVSIAEDKDASGLLAVLARYDVSIIFTNVGARARSPSQLKGMAETLGMTSRVEIDPRQAYMQALEEAANIGGWVLVTGSLYLAGMIPRVIRN